MYLCNHNLICSMADNHTAYQRHRNMAAIHSAATEPELSLRRALWHLGFRYCVNVKRLPGSPDIVLPKYHKACKNASTPKTNTEFWIATIARNQQRDQEVWRQLEAKGWSVIIVWECQLKKTLLNETIARVEAEILCNGELCRKEQEKRYASRIAYRQEQKSHKEREAALLAEIK